MVNLLGACCGLRRVLHGAADTYARVDHAVEQVGDEVGNGNGKGPQQDQRHDHRVIPVI